MATRIKTDLSSITWQKRLIHKPNLYSRDCLSPGILWQYWKQGHKSREDHLSFTCLRVCSRQGDTGCVRRNLERNNIRALLVPNTEIWNSSRKKVNSRQRAPSVFVPDKRPRDPQIATSAPMFCYLWASSAPYQAFWDQHARVTKAAVSIDSIPLKKHWTRSKNTDIWQSQLR